MLLNNFFASKEYGIKAACKIISLLLFCFATIFILFCTAAFVITKTDFSYGIIFPVTTILLSLASFIDSFVISRIVKENGFVIGLVVAAIIFSLVLCVSLYFKQFKLSAIMLTKLSAIVLSGVIGGIVGVNTN
ncbi:MAG: TIGR04086 family membrane protein [Oscillospiraceae bacterium]